MISFQYNLPTKLKSTSRENKLETWLSTSPVRYAKFESIRYFIDIDIFQNHHIDIDINIFQNHHIDINIDIDIFGITLSISISIFFRIALSISISISIFSTSPYRYRYRYFSKVSIYRQSIFHIDILTRRRSNKNVFYRCTRGRSNKMCFTGAKKCLFLQMSTAKIFFRIFQNIFIPGLNRSSNSNLWAIGKTLREEFQNRSSKHQLFFL